jgi:hypothetical protein
MTGREKRDTNVEATIDGTWIVDAELLDTGLLAPRPGDMYVISLMRYQVLQVVQGVYSQAFILVGHAMPDLSAPAFQIGRKHRLQLIRQFPKHASILNKFEHYADGSEIFFCPAFQVIE